MVLSRYDKMGDNDRINIEKLDGAANWLIWKFQMRQILESVEVYEVACGTSTCPVENSENYQVALPAWRKRDVKARRIISTACGRDAALQIMNCNTAAEMWPTLKSNFEQASKSNILFLQQKYYAFTKDPDDTIAIFMAKLMEIVQQLRDQNESISESMVMTKILMSLPAEYNHFHSAWESTNANDQTMTNLRARLLAEELRMKSQGRIEGVEALLAKLNLQKKSNTKADGSSKGKKGQKNKKGKSDKPKGKCFGCGESGHWKSDCPKNKEKSSKRDEGTSSDAFMCHIAKHGSDKNVWILDSGASDHMCYRRDWFSNFFLRYRQV